MKKTLFLAVASVVTALCLVSCSSQKASIIPRAVNTMSAAVFKDLNLSKGDYEIFNTVTAEATVSYTTKKSGNVVKIQGTDGDFVLQYEKDEKGNWTCKYQGVMRYGYFGNDYLGQDTKDIEQPEMIARRMAIYRAIGLASEYGADAMIEPTIATNVEQEGDVVYFKSTVVAKLLRIKTHK